MARILDLFLNRKTNLACEKYPDPSALFAGLLREETEAIRCLSSKVSGSIFKLGKAFKLTDDDIEELICDCITICLQKIKTGQYQFQGYHPATFVIEIAKNRAQNFRRAALKHQTLDLENQPEQSDEIETGTQLETEILEKLLAQLEPNCQNLIRLKYLEERRDKEVIDAKLTQYTTVDALKNHRAKCMRKLVELAAASSFNQ
jgi:DNA-directed RNA polymerase specialized sigma24 family protein